MKYHLSVKSFILLFSRLTSVIKCNDVMVKCPLSDETIWLTMNISFRFIRLENMLHHVMEMNCFLLFPH
jgi:hypothetical protein